MDKYDKRTRAYSSRQVFPGDIFFVSAAAVDINSNEPLNEPLICRCTKREGNMIYSKDKKFIDYSCVRVRLDPSTINLYVQ